MSGSKPLSIARIDAETAIEGDAPRGGLPLRVKALEAWVRNADGFLAADRPASHGGGYAGGGTVTARWVLQCGPRTTHSDSARRGARGFYRAHCGAVDVRTVARAVWSNVTM